jgi:phenylalanyl-tRNA synthetase alpha chain
MVELREHEHKTLSALNRTGGKATTDQLIKATGLPDAAVMRSTLTLQEKQMVQISEQKQTTPTLTDEGRTYAKEGLPERRMANALNELNGKASLDEAASKADLEKQFISIALGWLQRKKWAAFDSKTNSLQVFGKPEEGTDEKVLELLDGKQVAAVEELSSEFQEALQVLKGRKLVKVEEKIKRIVELTDYGRALIRKGLKATAEVTQLTPELIVTGKWRKAKLQKYNVEAPVAKTWPGKKHPYLEFLDEVKEKLVALGFSEMAGTFVETSFFNFDALYTPQGHPARELAGAYYVDSPKYGNLSAHKQVVENVKRTHEDGWKTGSTGWKYDYDVKEAGRLILRSHTTCLSARTLLSKDLEIPSMHFSIGRCFRPEVLDKTHLTEFNQVEGIVVDKDLTLRDLLGILEKFAIDIAGADKAKFVPDYFPFTEPSVELHAYKKGFGWIEFGGSGIFRPEVTLPLGIDVPVLAWGLGIDRLFMMKAGIDDIRQLFSMDLDWLRKQKVA